MTPAELQSWLEDNADEIFRFMDYEPTIETEDELRTILGFWFGDDGWDADGHRFVHLGIDGAGSQFAAWIRPQGGEPPVVFFGSEGGRGVLTASCKDWALALAHAPGINEYADAGEPMLSVEANGMLDESEVGEDELLEARRALETYLNEIRERYPEIPNLEALTDGLEELDDEFKAWVEERVV